MEYKIVTSDSIPTLVTKVNEAIADNWRPTGGVSLLFIDKYGSRTLGQSMVRYTEKES